MFVKIVIRDCKLKPKTKLETLYSYLKTFKTIVLILLNVEVITVYLLHKRFI